ncbi:MAG: tetratricopeptide repeat protein [Elusimicrobia bacterium]|nr:tetratricopeptide repeat protein [Elusimicrobiota bacterium]
MSHKAELKENILASKLETAVVWIVERRVQVATVLGVIVAAALISSVFFLRHQEAVDTSRTKLGYAQSLVSQDRLTEAVPVLEDIQKSPADTDTRRLAKFLSGVVAFGTSKTDDAIRDFGDAANMSRNHPLRPLALANLGSAYEQKQDFESAARTYTTFMSEFADHFMAPRVQLGLGRSQLLAGKKDDAKKSLEHLIDLYPTSEWAENARRLLDNTRNR